MPMADIITSSPYDSLMTPDTTGGYVGEEMIEGAGCHRLSYQQEVVDWQIWIRLEGEPLPCKLVINYKQDPGQPTSTMTFKSWNLAADVKEESFAYKIPEGYERIAMLKKVAPKESPEPQSQTKENQQ